MSAPQEQKIKRSLWETIKAGSGPYRRLFSYVKPYKGRFAIGLVFGIAYGAISGALPLVLSKVMAEVFGGAIDARHLTAEQLNRGPRMSQSMIVLCLAIPAIMLARSLCSYVNGYCMAWVSNKVLTDIRTQLFQKILSHSMDFFNRMRSGFLMSRITNDTRMMQSALSTVTSDLFKQPIAILTGVGVLLYMDWKFTIVTLVLFPDLHHSDQPLRTESAPCCAARAGRHGTNGRDHAGKLCRHPRDQVFRARRPSGENFSQQQSSPVQQCHADHQSDGSRRPAGRNDRGHRRRAGVVLRLLHAIKRGPFHRPQRRHLPAVRADQDPESHSGGDGTFHPGDRRDLRDPGFEAKRGRRARCNRTTARDRKDRIRQRYLPLCRGKYQRSPRHSA